VGQWWRICAIGPNKGAPESRRKKIGIPEILENHYMRLHAGAIGRCGNEAVTTTSSVSVIGGRGRSRLINSIVVFPAIGNNVGDRIDIIGITILGDGISYHKPNLDILYTLVLEYSG
jgi:hypothetical protein